MPADTPLPPGWRLRIEDTVASTSDLLVALAQAGEPEGLAILARTQTGGRGRDGRRWESPRGNLYLSVLLRPAVPAREAPRYALLAAVALAAVLERHLPDPALLRLKWPNDVLVGDAKLAGVLCESAARANGMLDWLVIGFGANLAVAPAVAGRATVALAPPRPPSPLAREGAAGRAADASAEPIAAQVVASLAAWRARPFAELLAAWQRRGPAPGTRLTLRTATGETSGLYRGLDAEGALMLDTDSRIRRCAAGELAD